MINKNNRVLLGEEVEITAKLVESRVERERWSVATFTATDSEDIPIEIASSKVVFDAVGSYEVPKTKSALVKMSGEWERNIYKNKVKIQFKVKYLYPILPRTAEESVVFLNSVQGIGRKTATAIISQFGTIENALQNEDVMVATIKAMTKTRVANLRAAIAEVTAVMDMVNLLSKTGIQNLTIAKIAEVYGAKSMDVVKNAPYSMLKNVSFRECDMIAFAQGWDPKSEERIRAAILAAIYKNRTEAIRIIMDGKEAIDNALIMCNIQDAGVVQEEDVRAEMKRMLSDKTLVATPPYVYLYEDYDAEVTLAQTIAQMGGTPIDPVNGMRHWAKFDEWKLKNPHIQLDGKQQDAVQAAANLLSIVTGGPGTGKTTVLKAIIETYRMVFPDSPITLMAPTGLAAKRMSESCGMRALTVHKAFGLMPADNGAGFVTDGTTRVPGGLVICDEFSMVSLHLANFILNGIDIREDTRIVFVGDIDQLPPIAPGAVLEDLISSNKVKFTRLIKNFRQAAGSTIVDLAYAINEGNPSAMKYDGNVVFHEIPLNNDDIGEQADAILTKLREAFLDSCKTYGLENTYVVSPTHRENRDHPEYCLYSDNINNVLRDAVNPARAGLSLSHGGKEFRLHDRVINLKNGDDVINGDIGVITKVDVLTKVLTIDFDGKIVTFPQEKMKQLELAYCITVHKSQGCEFKSVIMPCSSTQKNMMTRKLTYTAITRAKSLMTFVGDKKVLEASSFKKDVDTIKRDLLGARINKYAKH